MSVRTQSALLAIFALTVPCTVWADDKPDVLEIIQKADTATKAVQEVSYRAEFWAEGEWASKMPKVTGEVFARRPARSRASAIPVPTGANGSSSSTKTWT